MWGTRGRCALGPDGGSVCGEGCLSSGLEAPVLPGGWHRVNDQFVAALEDEDDRLEQASLGIEAEPKFAVGPVLLVEGLHPERPVGRLDSVLCEHSGVERAVMDSHPA